MIYVVYCSGSIQKGEKDKGKICWSEKERSEVRAGADPSEIKFLNPDDPANNLEDTLALFGRDMYQIKTADAVIVDARERRGIGIGIEMLASRILGTFLISVVPNDTYYRMSQVSYRGSTVTDYVHPHLAILSDAIVGTFEEAGAWLASSDRPKTPKGIEEINSAIIAYKERMLPEDKPMLDILHFLENVKQ